VNPPKKPNPIDPIVALEQRFIYRLHEYLADSRNIDAEFTLPGLRGWMLCQKWPEASSSRLLEQLGALSWTMICQVESDPNCEGELRRDLGLTLRGSNHNPKRTTPFDAALSKEGRADAYNSLRKASEPGSLVRTSLGMPRFDAAEKAS
jgi:hypothetical protein